MARSKRALVTHPHARPRVPDRARSVSTWIILLPFVVVCLPLSACGPYIRRMVAAWRARRAAAGTGGVPPARLRSVELREAPRMHPLPGAARADSSAETDVESGPAPPQHPMLHDSGAPDSDTPGPAEEA